MQSRQLLVSTDWHCDPPAVIARQQDLVEDLRVAHHALGDLLGFAELLEHLDGVSWVDLSLGSIRSTGEQGNHVLETGLTIDPAAEEVIACGGLFLIHGFVHDKQRMIDSLAEPSRQT